MAQRREGAQVKPGERYDKLTVSYDTGERVYGSPVWECSCACGGHVRKTSKQLKASKHLSCGCDTSQNRMIGKRFGLLTVLGNSGESQRGRGILWDCICDCGTECVVSSGDLRSGKVTDCGCKSSLLGRQFGNLTVIGDEGTKTGDHVWRCRCTCGNECLATSSHLTHGRVKSCGCLRSSVWEENLKLVDGTSVTKLEARRANSDKLNSANTSGFNGVYPQNSHGKKTGRWVAQIGFKGRKYYLGAFDRAEDAAEARKLAEERLYDGFIEWYYNEYLPAQRETEPVISEKRVYGEQRQMGRQENRITG